MKRSVLFRGALTMAFGASAIFACSLGLDASKLEARADGGGDATVDTGGGDVTQPPPGVTLCQNASQCPEQGCYKPACIDGACHYELCPTGQACTHAACTGSTCATTTTPHPFTAAKMVLGRTGIGCEGSLGGCVAFVYPFAFVGHKTSEAPVAYPLVDFNATAAPDAGDIAPQPVKIEGASFTVSRIVASGRRVWFIGQPALRGADTTVTVAWIDVPPNPGLQSLKAFSSSIVLPGGATAALAEIYPGDQGGLIVFLKAGAGEPRRATQLKVADGGVASNPEFSPLTGYDASAPIVASSGDRLVTARAAASPPAASYMIDIIARAGAPNAVALGEQDLAPTMGQLYPGATFGQTPGGRVLAQGAVADVDADGGIIGVKAIRLSWFIQRSDDPNRAAAPNVDLVAPLTDEDGGAILAPPAGILGPIASVGEDMALALQTVDGGALVRGVRRSGDTAAVDPASKTTLPGSPYSFVMAGAFNANTNRAFGYAFSSPLHDADGVHVRVLELGCGGE